MDKRYEDLAKAIEHTLLSPTSSVEEVETLCRDAVKYGFSAVCLPPCRVALAAGILSGPGVEIASVAGFPLGFETVKAKCAEVADMLEKGAHHADVVINQGYLLDGEIQSSVGEIRELRKASRGAVLKIILETGRLSPAALAQAVEICIGEGVDYLKTSTGLGPRGASVEDVHFLKKASGGRAKIKAAGGVRTLKDAEELLSAGADRLGTSAGAKIMMELNALLRRE